MKEIYQLKIVVEVCPLQCKIIKHRYFEWATKVVWHQLSGKYTWLYSWVKSPQGTKVFNFCIQLKDVEEIALLQFIQNKTYDSIEKWFLSCKNGSFKINLSKFSKGNIFVTLFN